MGKDIFQNMLCILCCIGELAGNTEYVCTLPDIIFKIFFSALVRDLCQARLLAGKCLVKIKKLQLRIWQIPKLRWENCCLEHKTLFGSTIHHEKLPEEGVKESQTEVLSDGEAHASLQALCMN